MRNHAPFIKIESLNLWLTLLINRTKASLGF